MITIAIDGPAGAGKSTIAKRLAQELNITYLDTGAMYRTLGLLAMRKGVDFGDEAGVIALLQGADIDVVYESGVQHVYLDGEDVSSAIRQNEVSKAASDVSAIGSVRVEMVRRQQEIAKGRSVVMDGRDIGTHVLPDATYKFFVTAGAEERARRRVKELEEKGDVRRYEDVLAEMKQRDENDSTRAHAPLRQAEDAVLLDTTQLSIEQVIEAIKERMGRA